LYDFAPLPPLKTGIFVSLDHIGLGYLVYQKIIKRKKVKIGWLIFCCGILKLLSEPRIFKLKDLCGNQLIRIT
jgi:hypothetical protein